jgi:hypothetical protein
LTSISKEASPIAPDNQSNVDAVDDETAVALPLNDQKSSAVPSDVAKDVASQQGDTSGNAPATEPSTRSTGLFQTNAPHTNTAEFSGMHTDLDVK